MAITTEKFDNGEKDLASIQEAVTGISSVDDKTKIDEYTDRFNNTRQVIPKIIDDGKAAIDKTVTDGEANFNASIAQKEQEFYLQVQYKPSIPWAANTPVSDKTQIYAGAGDKRYRPKPDKVPFTTGSTIADDIANDLWITYAEATLDQVNTIANAGDSQLAGGNIWPIENRDAELNDKPISTVLFKFTYAGERVLYRAPSPVTGTITNIGAVGDAVDITVNSVVVTLRKVNNRRAHTPFDIKYFKLSAGDEISTDRYFKDNAGGSATYEIVDASITAADGYVNHDAGPGLTAKLRWGERGLLLSKIGISENSDASHNTSAINETIKQTFGRGGGVLYVAGIPKFDDQIIQRETVRIRGIHGADRGYAGLKYVGTVFQDFIVNRAGDRNYMSLEELIVYGGEYQKGRARYPVRYTDFNTACYIKNCWIRDGLGLLRIDSGYYSEINNVVCQRVTPKQDSPSIAFTDVEYGQVYSGNNAPVHLDVMNASQITGLQISHSVCEAVTAPIAKNSLYLSGEDPVVNSLRLEVVGAPYESFNPKVQIAILSDAICEFNGFYLENVHAISDVFRSFGMGRVDVNTFTLYNLSAQTLVRNIGAGDFNIRNGQIWRADVERLDYTSLSGEGYGSKVNWDCVSYRTGSENQKQDSFATNNPHGCIDGPVRNAEKCGEYCQFPDIVEGFDIALGTDANGAYCTIKSGTFINQSSNRINSRVSVLSSGIIADQILRPNAASMKWRLYVGKAGNLYLDKSPIDFTDPRGNWLASFVTNSAGVPSGIVMNPRLALSGEYRRGTSNAVVKWVSDTAPLESDYRNLDMIDNLSGTVGKPIGWVMSNGRMISKGNYV